MEPIVLKDVTELVLKGGGTLTIRADGTLQGKFKHVQKGHVLTIEGTDGNNMVVMTTSGGIVSQFNNFSGSSIACVGSNSTAVVNGQVITTTGDGVYINGVKMVPETPSKKIPGEPQATCVLDLASCNIGQVKLTQSMSCTLSSTVCNLDTLLAQVRGNGDIILPDDVCFKSLMLTVQGNGDIRGGRNTRCKTGSFVIQGNGDISNITVQELCNATVQGNGDLRISKRAGARVVKTKQGHGTIQIKTE